MTTLKEMDGEFPHIERICPFCKTEMHVLLTWIELFMQRKLWPLLCPNCKFTAFVMDGLVSENKEDNLQDYHAYKRVKRKGFKGDFKDYFIARYGE